MPHVFSHMWSTDLGKNVIFFFFYKIGEQECRTGPVLGGGGWYQCEGGGGGERAWEGEYGANIVYTCM
jgi:hypothetical protein